MAFKISINIGNSFPVAVGRGLAPAASTLNRFGGSKPPPYTLYYSTFICRTLQEKLPCSQIGVVVLTIYSPKAAIFGYNDKK